MSCTRFEVAEFRAIYAEFEAVSDASIDAQIDRASRLVSPAIYGEFYEEAIAALTAHYIATAAQASASVASGLPVSDDSAATMKKAGEVSVQFSEAVRLAQMKSPFTLTRYGQAFEYWRELAGMGAVSL